MFLLAAILCSIIWCKVSAMDGTHKRDKCPATLTIADNKYTYYCDSIRLTHRAVAPWSTAQHLLGAELAHCTTDRDSLDVTTAFVYRVLDMGGTADAQYPGLPLWSKLSLEQMYNYGAGDSGGIYCLQRSQMLKQLLNSEGFTDIIDFSLGSVHDFLLVRTRDNKLWICDAYGLWGATVNGQRTDFITYLTAEKTNPASVKVIDLKRTFGEPDELLTSEWVTLLKDCSHPDKGEKFLPAGVSKEHLGSAALGSVNKEYLPQTVFATDRKSRFGLKVIYHDKYTNQANHMLAGYTAEKICLAPDSIAPLTCPYQPGADAVWTSQMLEQIKALRKDNLGK